MAETKIVVQLEEPSVQDVEEAKLMELSLLEKSLDLAKSQNLEARIKLNLEELEKKRQELIAKLAECTQEFKVLDPIT